MQQKILITGCSSGIGLATAIKFAQLGWEVIATVRQESDACHLTPYGIKVKYCDQTSAEQIEALFADPDLEHLDAAFLNAGYGFVSAVEDTQRKDLEQIINCNLLGTWDYFNRCIKIFHQQGYGRILVTSSIVSFVPAPFRAAYGASKAGLDSMIKTFIVENNNPRIQVSLLNPGPVITKFRTRALQESQNSFEHASSHLQKEYQEQQERLTNTNRKRFTSTPEDLANIAVKALTSRKQKVYYLVGLPTYFMWYLQKFVPVNWALKFLQKTYKLEK
ncbi:SDR family NAD(P)-dependent oxidoreductase [Psittacicella gerlachiana]|uniref:Short-chain dehydrogenase n=1 Tax=Psittacicella gerlachiana TaxID=2028574 RepID=A0A3A1Y731_9GAMM|nr:SDR family NAD(P)-dependent oxidoreductase [Psittacicella gerlachiana]RIY34083.1 hypothetical protein CKF59_05835 [Psittacicella gerlachiana]